MELNKDRKKNRSTNLSSMVYGKIPPQAKELEEAILGACMIEKYTIDKVIELLKPECFYVDANQRIYKAMLALHKKNFPIDILTVGELLKDSGEIDQVGGPYYITKLTNSVVSSANIEFHCHIILDKFMKRELIRMGGDLIAGSYEDMTDVKLLLDEHEKRFTDITNTGHGKHGMKLDEAMVRAIQRIEVLRKNDSHLTGIPSGFHDIDKITHGWQPTDLIILAARPSVGKTAFAMNLARNATMNRERPTTTVFFSLEMSVEQLTNRILSSESEIWLDRIINGRLDDDAMRQLYVGGIQKLAKAPLIIDDTPALNIFELRAKLRRLKRKHDIGLAIIDYLQLMSGDSNDSRNREREISQISRGLKSLAKELNIPIIALSQLSREPDKRKGELQTPRLSDLRESGAIEQDADVVMFLYRPEYYDKEADEMGESNKGLTHVSIDKHRNGSLAKGKESIKLKFIPTIQKFVVWENVAHVPGQLGPGNWRPIVGPSLFGKDELSTD